MSISPKFFMSGDEARGLLFGLMEADKIQLRKYPDMPSMRQLIREGKVVYEQWDPEEHWKTYKELIDEYRQNGVAKGDCEDLAVAVAAEDQVRFGVETLPYAYTPRPGLFHVVSAVPQRSISGGTSVGSVSAPKLPEVYGAWPVAMGGVTIPGYVLQDPSRAAGMGSYGFSPDNEVNVNRYRYGADSDSPPSRKEARRRDGRGLGAAFRSLAEGVTGGTSLRSTMAEIGEGIRGGSGVEGGWAKKLGESIPSALGLGKAKESKASEPSEVDSDPEELEHSDRSDSDDSEEDVFGFDDDSDDFDDDLDDDSDDEFGLDDFDDDSEEFGIDKIVQSEVSSLIDSIHDRNVQGTHDSLKQLHRQFHSSGSSSPPRDPPPFMTPYPTFGEDDDLEDIDEDDRFAGISSLGPRRGF